MKKEKIIGVYLITNKVNGKHYVGQSINIHQRWGDHTKPYAIKNKDCPALYSAFSKYGLANFTFTILAQCNSSELNTLESYYINKYDSKANGYNCTYGGDAVRGSFGKVTYKHDDKGEIIDTFTSLTAAAESINTSVANLSKYAMGKSKSHLKCKGYYWSFSGDVSDIILKYNKAKVKSTLTARTYGKTTSKQIFQYNMEGVLIGKYKSSIDAANCLGLNSSTLRQKVNKKPYKGFMFSHKELTRDEIQSIR